jgi:hypothetical protein
MVTAVTAVTALVTALVSILDELNFSLYSVANLRQTFSLTVDFSRDFARIDSIGNPLV